MSKTFGMPSKNEGLVLSGQHKKLKTMKKKFFVLYRDSSNGVARLEYYDNEKKFKQGVEAKRTFELKNCFNVNRRLDTKYQYVVALSTTEGGFGIVFDNEGEFKKWIESLRTVHIESTYFLETHYPAYEHVWQVNVQKKGIAEEKGLVGNYHICLSSKSLTFIGIGSEKTFNGENRIMKVEILLTTIRRCGDSHCFFYMEVGRQSIIGPGELWMEAEDILISQNMHKMILSAMSAKTESNTNLSTVVQKCNEAITAEPMRKRSSSANEASKPVLQKRQLPIEIKSDSPQNLLITYGRERCDSLPTRNRTSECNSQSYASNNTFRSNNISGFRPYTCQRHSNSPPMNHPINCSESEESSVSVDEQDDNGGFISYRFHSRSSEGVIPEENTDDFTMTEKSCEFEKDTESYTAMAPVKTSTDLKDISNLNQYKQKKLTEESKSVGIYIGNTGTPGFNCDFPEVNYDKSPKELDNDFDQQRPARAYSIGSKIEHSKINRRITNNHESENQAVRVRAFSVGSRAKIPRCDLQRGAVCSKSRIQQNFNSSNNNISPGTDLFMCNEPSNVIRDKKSTSAPLLIPKNHNYDDHMVLDFSRRDNRNYSSTKLNQLKTVSSTMRNNVKKNDIRLLHLSPDNDDACICGAESGYLEMKPVGNSLSNGIITTQLKINIDENSPQRVDEPKTTNIRLETRNKHSLTHPTVFKTASETFIKTLESNMNTSSDTTENKKSAITSQNNENIILINDFHNSNNKNSKQIIPIIHKSNSRNLLNKFNKLKLESFIENENNCKPQFSNTPVNKKGIPDQGKLVRSMSDENIFQNFSKSERAKIESDEFGNKILQINSDSVLCSMMGNRISTNVKGKWQKHHKASQTNDNNWTVCRKLSNKLSESSDLTNRSSEKSASCCNGNNPTTEVILDCTSRPPSLTSEHELHYASLDLPQCSTQSESKTPKKEVEFERYSQATNSYAKIDFEMSDSSSASSKTFNT